MYLVGRAAVNTERETTSLPTPTSYFGDNCAVTYEKPIEVEWTGEVIAQFLSGTTYGIKKFPEDKENPYFYAGRPDKNINRVWEEKKEVGLEGLVKVVGQWVGMTDAYKNTIFGRCVPKVDIESIVQVDESQR